MAPDAGRIFRNSMKGFVKLMRRRIEGGADWMRGRVRPLADSLPEAPAHRTAAKLRGARRANRAFDLSMARALGGSCHLVGVHE
ncbi:MAG: hypothetical protein VCB42_11425, partial [Myxococcota bacterium]